jgi:glutamyl-tRNA synthetase
MREPEFGTIRFLHHQLIKDEQGNKLSKSAGSTSIQAMRAEHSTPAAFYRRVSALLELPELATGIDDLLHQAKFQLA